MDTQNTFRSYLRLVGKAVQLGLKTGGVDGSVVRGTVRNAMFDSFILEISGGNKIIRFEDVAYLEEV